MMNFPLSPSLGVRQNNEIIRNEDVSEDENVQDVRKANVGRGWRGGLVKV